MRTNKILMLGILALGLVGCAMEGLEGVAVTARQEGDTVRISTTIARVDSRLAYEEDTGNTTFTVGDKIQVENKLGATGNKALYTLNESSWKTTDAFVWNGSTNNQFEAWYPATVDTSFSTFQLPTDQSTEELLAAADWMTASTDAIAKPADGTLNLAFQHLLTKVTVKLKKWNNEFDDPSNVTINYPKIYSKGTKITASYSKDATTGTTTATIVSDIESIVITPLKAGTDPYPTFTAIVAPNATYVANDKFMTFDIGEDTFIVLAKEDVLAEGLQPGKHYTFNLTVGQDKVTIEQVSMNDIGYPFGEGWNNDFETDLN